MSGLIALSQHNFCSLKAKGMGYLRRCLCSVSGLIALAHNTTPTQRVNFDRSHIIISSQALTRVLAFSTVRLSAMHDIETLRGLTSPLCVPRLRHSTYLPVDILEVVPEVYSGAS